MKITEIIKMWWGGLTNTSATIKKLEKSKLNFKDGAYSLISISFIIALLILMGSIVLTAMVESNSTAILTEGITLFLITLIGLSLISLIGLAIFTWLFRKVADKSKGKGKFEKEAALFGIVFGMLFITMIPYLIGYLVMFLTYQIPIISYTIYGLGMMISVAYAGKVSGLLIETLVSMEKLKISKITWVNGLTIGIIYLAMFILFGLLSQITGITIPMA